MRVNTKEAGLLVSDCNSNQNDKDSIIQLAFEEFEVPAYFTIKKSILSLFASGRTTGLVLESGANLTQVVPVSEGYILYKSMATSHIGGDTVTQHLINHIEENRGKELLPSFNYQYSSENEGQRNVNLKDIGHVDPSVLDFHKKRFSQEMKELYFKVATPSEEG
jgi:actin-like protein 6A